MSISDEAVEAAALALFERDYGVGDWNIATDQVKAAYIDEALTALAAAGPHLQEQAWDEGVTAQTIASALEKSTPTNPYRSQV